MGLIIGIVIAIVVVVSLLGFIASRIITVPASKALAISGSAGTDGKIKIVPQGGRTFLIPVIQSATEISLGQKNVKLEVKGVDQKSVETIVSAVAIFKVGSTEAEIRKAAERYLDNDDPNLAISRNAQQTLTGALRSIVANMTIADLISKRDLLSKSVLDAAKPDLDAMGLSIDSFQIDDIGDGGSGYIKNMGVPEIERVAKEARIAQAKNNQEANYAEIASRKLVAEQNRELAIREAELKVETERVQAEADAAGPIAKAAQDQQIATIEQEAAEARAILRERELDLEIRRPADADLYRREKEAEASKIERIRHAEAEAENIRLEAEADSAAKKALSDADAHAKRVVALAEAESVTAIGQAEASTIEARGLAEAIAIEKKAEGFAKYTDAAIIETIISKMPEIAKELASPISNIKDLTVVSTDGAGAIPKMITSNFAELDGMVNGITGVSLVEMVKNKAVSKKSDETPPFEPFED